MTGVTVDGALQRYGPGTGNALNWRAGYGCTCPSGRYVRDGSAPATYDDRRCNSCSTDNAIVCDGGVSTNGGDTLQPTPSSCWQFCRNRGSPGYLCGLDGVSANAPTRSFGCECPAAENLARDGDTGLCACAAGFVANAAWRADGSHSASEKRCVATVYTCGTHEYCATAGAAATS